MDQDVYVHDRQAQIVLGNELIERVLDISDGVLRTVRVIGKSANRELTLRSQELSLALADGRTFTNCDLKTTEWTHEETPGGGRRVMVHVGIRTGSADAGSPVAGRSS